MSAKMSAAERRECYRDLQGLTQYIGRDLRQGITSVHGNAKHISNQCKFIHSQIQNTNTRDAKKWEELADRATIALKEAGDIQNWAEIMEVEISALEETMRLVDGK
ncbi:uncharacterized protein V1510DRAFT_414419 [Dipodascopsis tothii]|uniref:uncharacterized protein n=1 Tax=Dipodascopsis tothii TaxID=44089 RepID=UPI0034CF164D